MHTRYVKNDMHTRYAQKTIHTRYAQDASILDKLLLTHKLGMQKNQDILDNYKLTTYSVCKIYPTYSICKA